MNEEKILKNLIKCTEYPNKVTNKQNLIILVSFLLATTLLLTAYFIIPGGMAIGKVAVLIAAFGGMMMFFTIYYKVALQYNIYLKKYLNKKNIEDRLNEIKT